MGGWGWGGGGGSEFVCEAYSRGFRFASQTVSCRTPAGEFFGKGLRPLRPDETLNAFRRCNLGAASGHAGQLHLSPLELCILMLTSPLEQRSDWIA